MRISVIGSPGTCCNVSLSLSDETEKPLPAIILISQIVLWQIAEDALMAFFMVYVFNMRFHLFYIPQ
ncbi:hypothetical protein CLV51_103719 [Chitinophaga niastensis]|uniref:Uncharacterized protein n=1 Tax=Chitinophaga niastensis TaxID=536980 RepID=A0A2P8HKJ5_CHINA|nr:hypothetical protein CLV51_103719 [Chitinophaga niastensis]